MKYIFLIITLLSLSLVKLVAQNNFILNGKWSFDKIKIKDTLIIFEDRFFTFNKNKTYEFGEINHSPIATGKYTTDSIRTIKLNPISDISSQVSFSINILSNDSVNLENDTITLFLSTFYTPPKFVQNPEDSKKHEIKGWDAFKNEHFDLAVQGFKRAYQLDSTNYNAIIGLIFSKGANDGEMDVDLIKIVTENTEETTWGLGMGTAGFILKYSPKREPEYKDNEINTSSIAACYTDKDFLIRYENGTPKEKGCFKNKKPFGKWIKYRTDGSIFKTTEYLKDDSTKIYIFHKNDGEPAVKEIVHVNGNMETTVKIFIYYQELPDKLGTYLFVSKTGFCIFDSEKKIELNASTPDNFIEEVPDPEKGRIWYIWKGGKKSIYRECELDGTITWEYQGDKPGKYKWQNCRKILVEPIK